MTVKHKLFSLLLTSILSHCTSAQENLFQLTFPENASEYTLWAEMAFKHSVVETIKTLQSTNSALGIDQLDGIQKKLISLPLSVGALAAVFVSSHTAYNKMKPTTARTVSGQAQSYLGKYIDNVSSLDNIARQKQMQYRSHRRAIAQHQGFQIQTAEKLKNLQSQIKTNVHVSRWGKVARGSGFAMVGVLSVGAYLSIIGNTAVIAFEDDLEMQGVLEQFSNDIYNIASRLGVSEGMELAGAFEINSEEGV